jgi:hypothetical protein
VRFATTAHKFWGVVHFMLQQRGGDVMRVGRIEDWLRLQSIYIGLYSGERLGRRGDE